jgi:methyltransferase OMS1, mitochondrial
MATAAKLIGGTVVGLGGFWAVAQMTAMGVSRTPKENEFHFPTEKDRKEIFSKLAPTWDATVRWDEFSSGISRWRRQLISRAHGDVLEVAVGTGRNLSYYDEKKISSLTCIDFSRRMLEILLTKKNELGVKFPVKLKCANCAILNEFEDDSFDTVVDTFGVCSFEDPVGALREMARVCKPDGQILLLEHGESDWPFMQNLLSRQVPVHVSKFGCYNHRSIEHLINDAGLEIVERKRKHWGTIYFFVCRKRSEV